jgi:hypothetical protein
MMSQHHQKQQQLQQISAGECNLLPVLVERLRSTLEYFCANQKNDNYLILKKSDLNSEEDFKPCIAELSDSLIALNHFEKQENILQKSKLGLKFFEDILLADIHSGLISLQDTLKRVDIDTLTRYKVDLNPINKLYLLRLISNLLAKLKIPKDANFEQTKTKKNFHSISNNNHNDKCINSVSSEELIQSSRPDSNKKISNPNESSIKIDFKNKNEIQSINEKETTSNAKFNIITDHISVTSSIEFDQVTDQLPVNKLTNKSSIIYDKNAVNNKCMKDAVNQQQLRNIKNNYDLQKENEKTCKLLKRFNSTPKIFSNMSKDDSGVDIRNRNTSYYNEHFIEPTRYNKIIAKKTKIKRANTIDIPNYTQLKSDNFDQIQNNGLALKRPINVGDKIINSYQKVIPSFEPKTDNDRKFLALINKNSETVIISSSSHFKNLNYHQTATLKDKNWSNRFSSIKTNFDKLRENQTGSIKKFCTRNDRTKMESIRDDKSEKEKTASHSVRKSMGLIKQQQSIFTHAPTSLFQKIVKPKVEFVPVILNSNYISKNNMLVDKLKMFDQEYFKSDSQTNNACLQSPVQIKFGKSSEDGFNSFQTTNKFEQGKKVISHSIENAHISSYPLYKQFTPLGSDTRNLFNGNVNGNINSTKFKLLINLNKDISKAEMKQDKSKVHSQVSKNFFLNSSVDKKTNFLKQYSYNKLIENYPMRMDEKLLNQGNKKNNIKSKQLSKKNAILNQNIAVQTFHESIDKNIPEIEFITPIKDLSQNYSENEYKKLYQPDEQQSSLPQITNIPNYSTHQFDDIPQNNSMLSNYYNSNYVSENKYIESNDCIYKSIPYLQSFDDSSKNGTFRNSIGQPHSEIPKKLYNEFSKLSNNKISKDYSVLDYSKINNLVFGTVSIPYRDIKLNNEKNPSKPIVCVYKEKQLTDLSEKNIQNQVVSRDGIITHYTCAIATVSSISKSAESTLKNQSLPKKSDESITRHGKEIQLPHFNQTNITLSAQNKIVSNISPDKILDSNTLQQNISSQQLSQIIDNKENKSSVSPSFYSAIYSSQSSLPNKNSETQKKINLFEEKRFDDQRVSWLSNIQSKEIVASPTSMLCNERSVITNDASTIDSSEKYLMSCASKPTRNIVLSKSESWHQLAIAKNATNSHFSQSLNGIQLKPTKQKSPSSLKLSKQFEASSVSENMRQMEKKILRYFQSSTCNSHADKSKQTNSREAKNKCGIQFKKYMNNLSRSHTMPDLYDEKIFEENIDIDVVFERIFKEATRFDKRY